MFLNGMAFRVRHTAKVQQAPSHSSVLLYTASVGKVVKQTGSAFVLADGTTRIPIAPRGYIDSTALEPLDATEDKQSITSSDSISRDCDRKTAKGIAEESNTSSPKVGSGWHEKRWAPDCSDIDRVGEKWWASDSNAKDHIYRVGIAWNEKQWASDCKSDSNAKDGHDLVVTTWNEKWWPSDGKSGCNAKDGIDRVGSDWEEKWRVSDYKTDSSAKDGIDRISTGWNEKRWNTDCTSASSTKNGIDRVSTGWNEKSWASGYKNDSNTQDRIDQVGSGWDEKWWPSDCKSNFNAKDGVNRPILPESNDHKIEQSRQGDSTTFRIRYNTQVRAAVSKKSEVLYDIIPGELVKQLGKPVVLYGGVSRVPLQPRGWIDGDALESISDSTPFTVSQQSNSSPTKQNGWQDVSDDRNIGAPTHEVKCVASEGSKDSKNDRDSWQQSQEPPSSVESVVHRLCDDRNLARARHAKAEPRLLQPASELEAVEPHRPINNDFEGPKNNDLEGPIRNHFENHSRREDESLKELQTLESQETSAPDQSESGVLSNESPVSERIAQDPIIDLNLEASLPVDSNPAVSRLNCEIVEYLQCNLGVRSNSNATNRILLTMSGILRKLGTSGNLKLFGSASTGLKTGSSDVDVAFNDEIATEDVIPLLAKFADALKDTGFENVTKILQSSIPIIKCMDIKSRIEVDFCIANKLGIRNSLLLDTYCRYDPRVIQLGLLVKDWAKRHELVGTADGCINSYAYMLMTIHFLQSLQPSVVLNLQILAKDRCESVPICDNKWGTRDTWETKFMEDFSSLESSWNEQSVGELLIDFFSFYAYLFDWSQHAVCIRLARPGIAIDKYTLATPTRAEQWYIEDPFDLKHNLAGRCSEAGRARIRSAMEHAYVTLRSGSWIQACPPGGPTGYFLKCRISNAITPEALLDLFKGFDLYKLHFPTDWNGPAFFEFSCSTARRRAHTANETYVEDCQLHLHYSSSYGLAEAAKDGITSYFPDGSRCATFESEYLETTPEYGFFQ